MKSTRNPCEASYAAVDTRLFVHQREELLRLIEAYQIDHYYIYPQGTSTIMHNVEVYVDYGRETVHVGTLDYQGRFFPSEINPS